MDRPPIDLSSLRLRLEFQLEAAQVQMAAGALVRRLLGALDEARARGTWSEADTKRSGHLIALGHDVIQDWLELAPPAALHPNWAEMLGAFEDLDRYLEEFASFKDIPDERLRSGLTNFQTRFRSWMRSTNLSESRLAERELDLTTVKPVVKIKPRTSEGPSESSPGTPGSSGVGASPDNSSTRD